MINETTQTMLLAINSSTGAIPLEITTTTNWSQLILSLVISSVFLVYMFAALFKEMFFSLYFKLKLHQIKKKTGRNVLMIKHTVGDLFNTSMIQQKTLLEIQKALMKFKGKPFDLILHTPGGEVFAAQFISRILKQYPNQIRCLVPNYAMSGGTLLMLSCSEIYFGDGACAGPVDVQLGNLFKYGSARSWQEIVNIKGKKAEDSSISFSLMGKQYTKSMQELLFNTVDFGLNEKQKLEFIEFMTNGEVEHAYSLTREKLESFGIKVKTIDPEIQGRLLKMIISNGNEGVSYC